MQIGLNNEASASRKTSYGAVIPMCICSDTDDNYAHSIAGGYISSDTFDFVNVNINKTSVSIRNVFINGIQKKDSAWMAVWYR